MEIVLIIQLFLAGQDPQIFTAPVDSLDKCFEAAKSAIETMKLKDQQVVAVATGCAVKFPPQNPA